MSNNDDYHRFNINETIKVWLTRLGYELLADHHNALAKECPSLGVKSAEDYERAADKRGYTKFQMWIFIETFGPVTNLCEGGKYYQTEILIPKDECK
jgi:hypothetical protein